MLSFIIISGICLLVAITVHEAAHAWMANYLGDPTPRLKGRLSLNPLVHLDPIGTLVLVITGFRFGWGKPVEFDPYNLQNPKRDAALISIAGPVSNLVFASILSLIFRLFQSPIAFSFFLGDFFQTLIFLNIGLAVFNLIPMHPLDGGKILIGLLPDKSGHQVDLFMSRYGFFVLLILILPVWNGAPLVSIITAPILNFLVSIFLPTSLMI